MEKLIDLHIHTTVSDGVLSPKEVIDEAVKNNVKILSIADHDTIDAYSEEFLNYAKEKKITVIPAVEISTKTKGGGVHVLGYNIDIYNQEFKDQLFLLRNARHKYLQDVSVELQKLGYMLDVEELDKIETVTKAHIARNVIAKEENKECLLKNFGYIPQMGEFIETVMNEGCPAYVKKKAITPKEAALMIRKAGGKVILAHPVAYIHEDNRSIDDILEIVLDMQADGIESNYIYIDRNNHIINEVDTWNKVAQQHHLLTTIGSDFHNDDGIRPLIGLTNYLPQLTEEEINTIINSLY